MTWVLLVLGCTGNVDTGVDPKEEELQWGWTDTSSPVYEDPLSLEQLDALLTEAFHHLHTLDPVFVLDAFEALNATVFETGCPVIQDNVGFSDIDADCVTSAGVQLIMDIRWQRPEPTEQGGAGSITENALLIGEAMALYESDALWNMSSIYSITEKQTGIGIRSFEGQLVGSLLVPGASGWIGEPLSLALLQNWYTDTDGSTSMAVSLTGGAGNIGSETLATYSFLEWSLWTEEGGGPCTIEPHGSVELHTPGGSRYQVVFDGVDPEVKGSVPEDHECDGKAEAFLFGQSLGEFEPDLSALMDWEERPW